MGKFALMFLSFLFMLSFSFGYVDKCGLINLLDYKNDYYKVLNELQHYPIVFSKVNNVAVDILNSFWDNPRYYKVLLNQLVDYSYNHNLCKNPLLFLEVKYLCYILYEKYLSLSESLSGIDKLIKLLSSN